MKHKRQTLSKDDPEIKDSKSKSESSLNEDKTQSCQSRELPPSGGGLHPVKEEEGEGGGVKKEDLSDHENSESVSSIPDSEEGGGERVGEMLEQAGGEVVGGGGDPSSRGSRLTGRGIHSPLSSPSGPGGGGIPLVPPGHPRNREVGGPAGGLPVTATVGKNKLTSLANLSPTPKSLLTGSQLLLLRPFCFTDQRSKTHFSKTKDILALFKSNI